MLSPQLERVRVVYCGCVAWCDSRRTLDVVDATTCRIRLGEMSIASHLLRQPHTDSRRRLPLYLQMRLDVEANVVLGQCAAVHVVQQLALLAMWVVHTTSTLSAAIRQLLVVQSMHDAFRACPCNRRYYKSILINQRYFAASDASGVLHDVDYPKLGAASDRPKPSPARD